MKEVRVSPRVRMTARLAGGSYRVAATGGILAGTGILQTALVRPEPNLKPRAEALEQVKTSCSRWQRFWCPRLRKPCRRLRLRPNSKNAASTGVAVAP